MVELNFMGKDSMLYHNTFAVEPVVWTNLREFVRHRAPGDRLFEGIKVCLLMADFALLVDKLFCAGAGNQC
jgi:hypothetical protein